MRFYTQQHQFYCGIDLHARTMYLCILNRDGEMLMHSDSPPGNASICQGHRDQPQGRGRLCRMNHHVVLIRPPRARDVSLESEQLSNTLT